MPVRYDQDIKAKAIRLVREHAGDYPSEYVFASRSFMCSSVMALTS
jgi:hypothetical protein